MTKVDVHFDLVRSLADDDVDAIARVHGVYGIYRVQLAQPLMNAVTVEFDASRLTEHDVEAALLRTGIPIVRR
jgi:hypothetical protein